MPSTAFNYEIVEKVAVLSQSGDTTKELNRVSYNGSPAKYDLRSWRRTDGEEKLLKGLTLTEDEARALKEALTGGTNLMKERGSGTGMATVDEILTARAYALMTRYGRRITVIHLIGYTWSRNMSLSPTNALWILMTRYRCTGSRTFSL